MAVGDSSPIWQAGALAILGSGVRYDAVGVTSADVVEAVASAAPDALVLDATLGNEPYATDLVAELLSRVPELALVITVPRARPAGMVAALELGVGALLHRQCTPQELVAAVAAALRGQHWVSAPIAALLSVELQAEATGTLPPELSPREREVLQLLAAGGSNSAIAAALGIAENTVRNHVRAILAKLGVANRTDAVATAVRRGLLEIPD
ncbi:MAG: response regulator transcription factor [Candidatus Nanopelagicales bacterium]